MKTTQSKWTTVRVPRSLFDAIRLVRGWRATRQKGGMIMVSVRVSEAPEIRNLVKDFRKRCRESERVIAKEMVDIAA